MEKYYIGDEFIYESMTVTKGTQIKYKKDDDYYKLDKDGREGLVEALVSEILATSSLDANEFVTYENCIINDKSGCRSKNFLATDEEFLSINTLYCRLTGDDDLSNYLLTLNTAEDRLGYILDIISNFGIKKEDYKLYLKKLLCLDMLICNTDRHVHNYGVIYNRKNNDFIIPPIFDNGRSLGTVLFNDQTEISCTLCGSFEMQVVAFGYPIQAPFYIDYDGAKTVIEKYYTHETARECQRILDNLEKYRTIFCKNNSIVKEHKGKNR